MAGTKKAAAASSAQTPAGVAVPAPSSPVPDPFGKPASATVTLDDSGMERVIVVGAKSDDGYPHLRVNQYDLNAGDTTQIAVHPENDSLYAVALPDNRWIIAPIYEGGVSEGGVTVPAGTTQTALAPAGESSETGSDAGS